MPDRTRPAPAWPRRCLAPLLLAATCSAVAADVASIDADPSHAWRSARQMLVVITPDWSSDRGVLHAFTRDTDGWRSTGKHADVSVGRAGLGWGLGLHPVTDASPSKAEGDGRAPAGVFALGTAFGAAPENDTALGYAAMTAAHHCIDVPASPYYNRIVDTRDVGDAAIAGSTEPMRRDLHRDGDRRYLEGFVIEHNPEHRAGAGSCIFAHLWQTPNEATAGCTAMPDATMQALLDWLDADAAPVLVQLPAAEYARLQTSWRLPTLPTKDETP